MLLPVDWLLSAPRLGPPKRVNGISLGEMIPRQASRLRRAEQASIVSQAYAQACRPPGEHVVVIRTKLKE